MTIWVTGGAGFIGSNVAHYFGTKGHDVTVIDNLSRPGVKKNAEWLEKTVGTKIIVADISKAVFGKGEPDVIFHFAAQVGVTASIQNPRLDLTENIIGSFNVLEAARKMKIKPLVVFASTNKVYGDIQVDKPVSESQPLSFCTPYGCSKGAADQYMLDYFKIYQIPTVVLRMSCVYGNRQFGTEEQGWLAHFMRHKNNSVTVFGDGTQVRDVLYIDDYVRLMKMLIANQDRVAGKVFNIGGGPKNVISINEALKKIGNVHVMHDEWRPADQKYYVSDITKIWETIAWEPEIGIEEGLERLSKWVSQLSQ